MIDRLAYLLLRALPACTAQRLAMKHLDTFTLLMLHRRYARMPEVEDPVTVMGVRFPNAVGLAAGIETAGTAVSALGSMGFGHIEVGPVTRAARTGTGFSRAPHDTLRWRTGFDAPAATDIFKGLSRSDAFLLRGGRISVHAGADPSILRDFWSVAHFFTVTPAADSPAQSLAAFADAQKRLADETGVRRPIAVKFRADPALTLESELDAVLAAGLDGVVLGGARRTPDGDHLSGAAIAETALDHLERAARHVQGQLALIAEGGILSPEDAVARMQAGASLVRIASGLLLRGPALVPESVEKMAAARPQGTRCPAS